MGLGYSEEEDEILVACDLSAFSVVWGFSLHAVRGEICAPGFRNPFRCGFDRATDDLYCGDVGHTNVEEVDIVE